jgi:undecaprenyl diphosphate synthase
LAEDTGALPKHLAIIMDGNGRWAQQRGLTRQQGHKQGVEAARQIVRDIEAREIRFLTLYAFSSENWRRPKGEVSFLMRLIGRYIESDLAELKANGTKLKILGRRQGLPASLLRLIDQAEAETATNDRLHLQIAFNYGGRDEIVDAVQALARASVAGAVDPQKIDEATVANALTTGSIPDPDLIIRTSGEYRLSNFLLWQAAYAELYFTSVLWPDFGAEDLNTALADYARRQRRFGDVKPKRRVRSA